MKKILTIAALLSLSYTTQAQVGIGTTDPKADLDIRTTNAASPTAYAGIAIPQVSALPSSGNRAGQLVYLTTTNLYYYFNGTSWNISSTQANSFGDLKHSYQTLEHNGWIPLNGTRTYASLTATQKLAADGLSLSTLPDLRDKFIKGKTDVETVGNPAGNNTATLTQSNLPNVNFTGNTTSTGDHNHTYNYSTAGALLTGGGSTLMTPGAATNSATAISSSGHNHTISVASGGTSTPISIVPSSIVANTFIYLGN